MKLRVPFIERIWRVNSSLTLDEPLAAEDVFARLEPLFQTQGAQYSIKGDTLTYSKTNPAAQDKLATFTSGTINAEQTVDGTRVSYDVASTALLLCFLAPLFFLAIGQFAAFINEIEKPGLIERQAEAEAEKEKEEEAKKAIEYHWIDQLLGASKPEEPSEDEEGEDAREGASSDGEEEEDEVEGNHSPETAYVFAGIFFVIFLVGRVLEPYLLKRTFRAALAGSRPEQIIESHNEIEARPKLAPQTGGNTEK